MWKGPLSPTSFADVRYTYFPRTPLLRSLSFRLRIILGSTHCIWLNALTTWTIRWHHTLVPTRGHQNISHFLTCILTYPLESNSNISRRSFISFSVFIWSVACGKTIPLSNTFISERSPEILTRDTMACARTVSFGSSSLLHWEGRHMLLANQRPTADKMKRIPRISYFRTRLQAFCLKPSAVMVSATLLLSSLIK